METWGKWEVHRVIFQGGAHSVLVEPSLGGLEKGSREETGKLATINTTLLLFCLKTGHSNKTPNNMCQKQIIKLHGKNQYPML